LVAGSYLSYRQHSVVLLKSTTIRRVVLGLPRMSCWNGSQDIRKVKSMLFLQPSFQQTNLATTA
jgi:hypothetical protein